MVQVRVRKGKHDWDDRFYVKCHLLARQGMSRTKMAAALGVSDATFTRWYAQKPALREAVADARADPSVVAAVSPASTGRTSEYTGERIFEYTYGRLPPDLQPVWDEMAAFFKEDMDTTTRIEQLLAGHGRRARQYLFLQALLVSGFNPSEACRKVNVSMSLLRQWCTEKAFKTILDEFLEFKKDWVEGCLMQLIKSGDTAATIFAAKTLLRDRGYDAKLTVKHEGLVSHLHQEVDVGADDVEAMPLDLQEKYLDWIRSRGQKLPPKTVTALPQHQEMSDEH